jgi:LysM domain
MKKHILAAAICAVIPLHALAQSDDDATADDALPEGSATVVNPPSRPSSTARIPPLEAGRAQSPNTRHTVEKGDTLWDLTQKYLGSPWYWPKVWSYNPEIANPHWIYPGNLVRFYGSGEEVPTQVEVGQPTEAPAASTDEVSSTGELVYRPTGTARLASTVFVTAKEIESAGEIVGSFSEVFMLSFPDKLYLKFKKGTPKLGETYPLFRRGGELVHPKTGKEIGYVSQMTGEVKVIKIEKNGIATAQITREFDDISREDFVGPSGESAVKTIAAKANDREIKLASVVGILPIRLSLMGEDQSIVVDKGSDDGVKAGNVFTIWRQHDASTTEAMYDPTEKPNLDLPKEDIGQCITYEVKTKATMCLLTSSMREIAEGDSAEMRVGKTTASR